MTEHVCTVCFRTVAQHPSDCESSHDACLHLPPLCCAGCDCRSFEDAHPERRPWKALSLTRPWPYTILELNKRIENRHNKLGMPPMCKYRGPLLLHAAQSWDPDVSQFLMDELDVDLLGTAVTNTKSCHPTGIVGACFVVGHVEPHPYVSQARLHVGTFDGNITTMRCVDRSICRHGDPSLHLTTYAAQLDLRWWMGGYGLLLHRVVAFPEAIPCKGHLGIWNVPAEVAARVQERCAWPWPNHLTVDAAERLEHGRDHSR